MNNDLITGGAGISAAAVFVQGILSFLSPCVMPLIPLYIGYLSGGTLRIDGDSVSFDRKKVIINTLFFVIGISFVFFMLGFGATGLSSFLVSHKRIISVIGGILITIFGIIQIFFYGKIGLLNREARLPFNISRLTMSPLTAFVLGLTFSFAWTPCIGPVLSGVLMMAASAETQTQGFMLIGLYTLGFILPFLAVGLFTSGLLTFLRKHGDIVRFTVVIGGILMIILGVLMITGIFSRLSGILANM